MREAGDGWYSTVDKDRNIWLENVNASSAAGGGEDDGAEAERDAGLEDTTPLERQVADESQQRRLLVNASDIIDEHGNIVDWAEWKLCVTCRSDPASPVASPCFGSLTRPSPPALPQVA